MSTLERIVPPLELCKQIPEGGFEDSALVWVVKGDHEECATRTMFNAIPNSWKVFPAPTLEEVLEAIGKVENWDTATITRPVGVNTRIVDTALKRWFKVKEVKIEI